MTPAILQLDRLGVAYTLHEYQHQPNSTSYGEEAAAKLGITPDQVFKTLVAKLDGKQLCVAVLPVSAQLSMKLLARAASCRKAVMADTGEAQRSSGYLAGGISPLGQKRRLPTFIDSSAEDYSSIYISAGRRGLEVALAPVDLQTILDASFVSLAQV